MAYSFVKLKYNHMKKNILKSLFCLFALAMVSPDYIALAQGKSESRSIIINNGDTTVNGRKFSELNKEERAKLRKEFKEMEKSFRGGALRSEGKDGFIKNGDHRDVVISRNGKEPNVLVWRNDISDDFSFDFDHKMPGELRAFKFDRDSLKKFSHDFQVFNFNGDSSMSFGFNTDSLMKQFNFRMDGLDTNIRKRIITMHRDMVPGKPGGAITRRIAPGMVFERGNPGSFSRNNSSSFNYNHTDKDGISSHMSIRLSDAGKETLKKITGAEAPAKVLDVSDLTLFPNFSNGKMTLSFNINSKGGAKVSILDSDLKQIFSDESANLNGSYVKQFALPKNGLYYVTISQNGGWFVKRLVKE